MFKIGDKVVCINCSSIVGHYGYNFYTYVTDLTYNEVYTVLDNSTCTIIIENDVNKIASYNNERFKKELKYERKQKLLKILK